jgi:hypothetical protein
LDFRFYVVYSIRRLHLKGDSLTREGFNEDLHFDEGLAHRCQHPRILLLHEKQLSNKKVANEHKMKHNNVDSFIQNTIYQTVF